MTTLKKKISEVSQTQTKLKTEVASLTGKIIILKET